MCIFYTMKWQQSVLQKSVMFYIACGTRNEYMVHIKPESSRLTLIFEYSKYPEHAFRDILSIISILADCTPISNQGSILHPLKDSQHPTDSLLHFTRRAKRRVGFFYRKQLFLSTPKRPIKEQKKIRNKKTEIHFLDELLFFIILLKLPQISSLNLISPCFP